MFFFYCISTIVEEISSKRYYVVSAISQWIYKLYLFCMYRYYIFNYKLQYT